MYNQVSTYARCQATMALIMFIVAYLLTYLFMVVPVNGSDNIALSKMTDEQ
jgi:hypothetical protein